MGFLLDDRRDRYSSNFYKRLFVYKKETRAAGFFFVGGAIATAAIFSRSTLYIKKRLTARVSFFIGMAIATSVIFTSVT